MATRTPRQGLQHAVSTVLPPVHGLNSTGAVAQMPAEDALTMDNLVSTDLGVAVREGYFDYATHINGGAEIRTVFAYNGAPGSAMISPLATSELFAATDNGIFDIEGGGDMTGLAPAIALSGNTYAGRLSTVHFTNDIGVQYLPACSETDGGFLYNGVAWMKMTSVGGPGPGIITGVDPATFVQVCAFKKRLMFVQRNSGKVWFLAANAVGGVASVFDFGPLLQHGGQVLALINWTQDGGDGTDDRLVIIGTAGDLVVYEGTDPSNSNLFNNVGTWYIGQPPVGRRCFSQTGGNPMVLTTFGIIPVGDVVQGGIDNILQANTELLQQLRKIQATLSHDFETLLDVPGWELDIIPSKALLVLARPSLTENTFIQYAFQQHNLAWSRLLDIRAVTFGRRLSEYYGGTEDGRVLRVLAGATDGGDLLGNNSTEIRSRLTPAFSYFGDPATLKQALMMRVNYLSSISPAYTILMNVDFSPTDLSSPSGAPAPDAVGSLWDGAFWDAGYWAGGRGSFGEWRSIEGMGYSLSPTLFIRTTSPTTIANIEYMTKTGGPL